MADVLAGKVDQAPGQPAPWSQGKDVQQVQLWFAGAARANAGEGPFATLIWECTQTQAELRGMGRFSDQLMQRASNGVGLNAFSDITDTRPSDHLMTMKDGGKVWDAYVLQKEAANGFSNWNEFKVAVADSNPGISDLNKIAADTTLMLLEKLPNGSITYNFVGGARINSNAANNEYYMIVPNPTGGWNVYNRVIDVDVGYIIKQISIDKYGRELRNFTGRQDTLQSEVKTISLVENTDFVDSLYANWTDAETTMSPLMLDLDGDGVETLDKAAGVHFAPRNTAANATSWRFAA